MSHQNGDSRIVIPSEIYGSHLGYDPVREIGIGEGIYFLSRARYVQGTALDQEIVHLLGIAHAQGKFLALATWRF